MALVQEDDGTECKEPITPRVKDVHGTGSRDAQGRFLPGVKQGPGRGPQAMSPELKKAFAHAFPFLEVMGDVTMGWMLLWRAAVAAEKLQEGAKKKDAGFYEGQIQSAKFFINTVLPVTLGKMTAIKDLDGSAVEIADVGFGGL